MDKKNYKKNEQTWNKLLTLESEKNLQESAIKELSDYYNLSRPEVKDLLPKATKLLADEWKEKKINEKDNESVVNFYNTTKYEMFELMDWHVHRTYDGPLNYISAMEIASKLGFHHYLDYGSGIGSGGIVFGKSGFDVTCADVSDPLMAFAKYRLEIRNIKAQFIDLKKNKPIENKYDVITCFDVLEHLVNPKEILKNLRDSLKVGGILILNNLEGCSYDELRPMHILKVKLDKSVRSMGFEQLWDLQKEFNNSSDNYIVVVRKVKRSIVANFLYYIYDHYFSRYLSKFIKKNKKMKPICSKFIKSL